MQRQRQCQRRAGSAEDHFLWGKPQPAERRYRLARGHQSARAGRPAQEADWQQPNFRAVVLQRLLTSSRQCRHLLLAEEQERHRRKL